MLELLEAAIYLSLLIILSSLHTYEHGVPGGRGRPAAAAARMVCVQYRFWQRSLYLIHAKCISFEMIGNLIYYMRVSTSYLLSVMTSVHLKLQCS